MQDLKTRQVSFARIAQRLDILLDSGLDAKVYAHQTNLRNGWPFEAQGQSFLGNPLVPEKDREWCRVAVITFLRDYARLVSLVRPRWMVLRRNFLCPPFHDVLSCVDQLKAMCLWPMLCATSYVGGSITTPLHGVGRKMLVRWLSRPKKSKAHWLLANSALDLKRVVPKVPDQVIEAALLKHSRAMETVHPSDPSVIDSIASECGRLTTGLDRSWNLHEWIQNISTSACVERGRKDGGAFMYFQDTDEQSESENAAQVRSRDGSRVVPDRPKIRFFDSSEGGVTTYVAPCPPSALDCYRLIAELRERHRIEFGTNHLIRKVVAIPEPCKARVITVHHAPEAAIWEIHSKRIQSFLARKRECLSGKTVDASSFSGMQAAMDAFRSRGLTPTVVSDDANAATDSLSFRLSRCAAEWLLPEDLHELFDVCLDGRLQYPESSDGSRIPDVIQQTGQLMGARWSFGFLCAIHMSAKAKFLSRYPIECRFYRVNGDDGVVVLPLSDVDEYFKFMSNIWTINRQKTIVSPSVFLFNSELRRVRDGFLLPKVRFNLIEGTSKYGDAYQDPTVLNGVFTSLHTREHRDRAWEWIMASRQWQEILKELSRKAPGNNWCLPLHLGGFGIERDWGTFHVTSQQMQMARWWKDNELQKVRRYSARLVRPKRDFGTPVAVMRRSVSVLHTDAKLEAAIPRLIKSKNFDKFDARLVCRGLPRERVVMDSDEYWALSFTMRALALRGGIGDEDVFTFISRPHENQHETGARGEGRGKGSQASGEIVC